MPDWVWAGSGGRWPLAQVYDQGAALRGVQALLADRLEQA
jgi:hypothetical protein